jgi:hypothetical protein
MDSTMLESRSWCPFTVMYLFNLPCQPFFDIVVANSDALFTTHLWYFVSYNFLWTVRSDTCLALYSLKILVCSQSGRFLSDCTTPSSFRVSQGVKKDVLPDLSLFSTVPRCLKRFKTPYLCFQQFYSYRTLPKVKIIFTTSLRSQIRCRCLVAKFSVIKLELSLFLYKIKVLT